MDVKQRPKSTILEERCSEEYMENRSDKKTNMVSVIFYSLILDLLAFTMILPLLPALLEHYKKLDDDHGLYNWILDRIKNIQIFIDAPERFSSVLFGGFLGSMYSFLQFLGMPIVGALSDVYGRKPLMLLCLFGIALSYLLWAFSHNFAIFVLARFVGGISKGNISLSMAVISDVTSEKTRGKSMALVGIAFSIGFVVGPMIGVLFSRFSATNGIENWHIYPALFAFFLAVSDLSYVAYCFEETLPVEKRATSLRRGVSGAMTYINPFDLFQFNGVSGLDQRGLKLFKRVPIFDMITWRVVILLFRIALWIVSDSIKITVMKRKSRENSVIIVLLYFIMLSVIEIFQLQTLRTLGRSYFLYLFVYSGLEFTLTFLTHHVFEFTSMQQGWMFLGIGLTMAILQGHFVRRISAEKTKFSAELGLWLVIPAFVFIGMASALWSLLFGVFIFSVSTALAVTCVMTLVTRVGPENQKGTITGIFRSLGALARACGPIVASIAFWSIGSSTTYLIGAFVLIFPPIILRTIQM